MPHAHMSTALHGPSLTCPSFLSRRWRADATLWYNRRKETNKRQRTVGTMMQRFFKVQGAVPPQRSVRDQHIPQEGEGAGSGG